MKRERKAEGHAKKGGKWGKAFGVEQTKKGVMPEISLISFKMHDDVLIFYSSLLVY